VRHMNRLLLIDTLTHTLTLTLTLTLTRAYFACSAAYNTRILYHYLVCSRILHALYSSTFPKVIYWICCSHAIRSMFKLAVDATCRIKTFHRCTFVCALLLILQQPFIVCTAAVRRLYIEICIVVIFLYVSRERHRMVLFPVVPSHIDHVLICISLSLPLPPSLFV
jgi:hypothetical protein